MYVHQKSQTYADILKGSVLVVDTMSEQNSASKLKQPEPQSGQSTSSKEQGKSQDEKHVDGETFDEFYKEVNITLCAYNLVYLLLTCQPLYYLIFSKIKFLSISECIVL